MTLEQSAPDRVPPQASRDFYNAFLYSRMLDYRIRRNPRLRKAAQRVLEYIQRDLSAFSPRKTPC
jgi:hypothetical protein